MKKLAVFCGVIILSGSVLAQEAEDFNFNDNLNQSDSESLIKAPQDAIKAVTETCHSWAKDDEVEGAELASYVLSCVNEELQYQGYLPVASID